METRHVGRPLRRLEDDRLLRGRALFVDDVSAGNRSDTLHVAFVRSPFASGVIRAIDCETARQRDGVVAVLTAEDLSPINQPGPVLVPPPPIDDLTFHARTATPLATDRVRHVGEAVAMVLATSRYAAEDARDDVFVDIEPRKVVSDLEAALSPESPRVHDDLDGNLAAHVRQGKGDYERVRRDAHLVVRRRLIYDHGASAAMENRGVVAHWHPNAEQLEVWDSTQAPIPVRNALAAMLGLSESQVRVVAPFIGGGFGPKIMFYGDELLIPWASMRYQRPVKWIEDREESFFATTQERSQIHDCEMALDENGRILGVRDHFLHDTGAYDPYGLTVPINSQCTLLGCYDIPNYDSEFRCVFTHRPVVTPYRGAGRQHGVFVTERLLDQAADELGIDRVEIRRRNVLQPDQFPHRHGLIYQDFTELQYDSGNYPELVERAAEAIDWQRFVSDEQPRARAEGRLLGIGLVTYVEGTGIGPYEGARVRVEASGRVQLATGVGTQGQGHFTSFAQVVAEQLGVEPADVRVVTGDTREFDWGTGTFASRGAVVAGNACHAAALVVRKKALRLAADELEAAVEDLELVEGTVRVKGSPDRAIALGDLAQRANPLRGAVAPGTEPGLEATQYFGPQTGTTAAGAHAMIVEIDPLSCRAEVLRYVVVHDCGTVLNPLILEGQIRGGVAQGIGNAFFEKLHYDDQGQLLNGSFMDYLLPTSTDVPAIEGHHVETPSPLNPLGVKGAGEAGAIPVGALYAQAVEDALRAAPVTRNLRIDEIPLSPNQLFEFLHPEEPGDDDQVEAEP